IGTTTETTTENTETTTENTETTTETAGTTIENTGTTTETTTKMDGTTTENEKTTTETAGTTIENTDTTTEMDGTTTEKILYIIKNNPYITASKIAESIGITRDGVIWQLKTLTKKGIIKHKGPTKGGFWKIM
ncbi:MAG: winged helix-turn-helix domain-containing protein, partial [Bacteroidales bacterium]|nr:winged helix-turn-helix domain-containing protein [Bacteroidales bacterium]